MTGWLTGLAHEDNTGPPVLILVLPLATYAWAYRRRVRSAVAAPPAGGAQEEAAAKGTQCACALEEAVAVLCRVSALLAALPAMAQPGKLLKEQKYDRQLR